MANCNTRHFSVNFSNDTAADFDWSAPVTRVVEEKLELNWDDLDAKDEKEDEVDEMKKKRSNLVLKSEKSRGCDSKEEKGDRIV